MSGDLRRLLAALLLACSGLVLVPPPAHACKCTTASVERQAQRADAVFTGELLAVSTDRADGRQVTTYRISAERLYRGDLASGRVRVTSAVGSCGLNDLPTGQSYVWFVSERGGDLTADQCGGTGRARDALVSQVEQALGEGTAVGRPPPEPAEHAEFTKVGDVEPESLTRLAAPGAAMVLVGLLGLFVVRRRTARD